MPTVTALPATGLRVYLNASSSGEVVHYICLASNRYADFVSIRFPNIGLFCAFLMLQPSPQVKVPQSVRPEMLYYQWWLFFNSLQLRITVLYWQYISNRLASNGCSSIPYEFCRFTMVRIFVHLPFMLCMRVRHILILFKCIFSSVENRTPPMYNLRHFFCSYHTLSNYLI